MAGNTACLQHSRSIWYYRPMATSVESTLEKLPGLLDALDPSLRQDFLDAVGLVSSQSRLDAASPDVDLGVVEGLSASIQQVAEYVRLAEKIARTAQTSAQQTRDGFNDFIANVHRAIWRLEEKLADDIHAKVEERFQSLGQAPPTKAHVRRALEETTDASRRSTTPDEDELLVRALLASLTPEGVNNAVGARLRRLVTDGLIGPPEVAVLTELAKAVDLAIDPSDHPWVAEVFALASTQPPLVVVMGSRERNRVYFSRLDQIDAANAAVAVRVTKNGTRLLALLASADSSPGAK